MKSYIQSYLNLDSNHARHDMILYPYVWSASLVVGLIPKTSCTKWKHKKASFETAKRLLSLPFGHLASLLAAVKRRHVSTTSSYLSLASY